MQIVNSVIETFIRKKSKTSDPILQHIEKYAQKYHVPIIEPEVARFLATQVSIVQPKKILEIGTAIGYSAIVMKKACPKAHITTIEIDEERYIKARENFEQFQFGREDIHAILGDAQEIVPILNDTFDFVFMDAAKGQYIHYFDDVLPCISKGGVLLIDNVLYQGMVCDPQYYTKRHRKITIVKRLGEFLDLLMKDDNFRTSIIPIDDGMAIAIKQ